jgi:hypothetical protein
MMMRPSSLLPSLSLFSSFSTLICCALPAFLVSLGAGAVVVGIVTTFPQLVWLSENKKMVFAISAAMLLLGAFGHYATRNAPCPADPLLARSCRRIRRANTVVLRSSIALYAIGFFFAFLANFFR